MGLMDIHGRLREVEAEAQRVSAPGWHESPRVVVPAVGLATGLWMFARVQGHAVIALAVIAAFVGVALAAAFARKPVVRASVKQDVKPDPSLDWWYMAGFMVVFFILAALTDFIPDPDTGISIVIAAIAALIGMVVVWLSLRGPAAEPVALLTQSRAAPIDAGLSPEELEVCAALIAAGATEGETRKEIRASALRSLIDADLTALVNRSFVTVFHERGSKETTDWVTLTRAGEAAARGQIAETRAA